MTAQDRPLEPDADVAEETASQDVQSPEASVEPSWEEKYHQLYDQFLRLSADFDNYRKRQNQEQTALRRYGAENTLRELLPVLDNLDRAQASLSEQSDPKMLYQSFRLMSQQLLSSMTDLGLKPILAVGQTFDPALHEAVAQEESVDQPDQTILREQLRGYLLYDSVLRPAQVVVSSQPQAEAKPISANPFKQAPLESPSATAAES